MSFTRLIGIAPLGIGLTVLGFLWLSPFGEFGSPPLFFRVFGTFIAIPFIMFGLAALSGKMDPSHRVRKMMEQAEAEQQGTVSTNVPLDGLGYQCPGCGARLGEDSDVSPLGDAKCEHCDRWFNIHGRKPA